MPFKAANIGADHDTECMDEEGRAAHRGLVGLIAAIGAGLAVWLAAGVAVGVIIVS